MADWLTHVLVAYALFTVASWYVEGMDEKWVAVAMVGSVLPDLNRFDLLVREEVVAYLVGHGFSWNGLHTLAGVFVTSAVGALFFGTRRQQKMGFLALLSGAVLHIVVDLPQKYPDGSMISDFYFYPVPVGRPPAPGWYVSADRWVVVVALAVAGAVFFADRHRRRTGE